MGHKKILVIDDDADMRNLLGVRLEKCGYEVVFAADAVVSVTAARRQHPDLIVLDLGLPGGDGYKVLERLRVNDELEDIPVMVFSGLPPEEAEEKSIRAGAARFVPKSASSEELIGVIGNLLAR